MKIIAFGDIHGCFQAAKAAISLSEYLGVKPVFLGDYIDRGPSGMKTIQAFVEAKADHPDWIFLRGNHDQMLLDLINGQRHPDGFDERTEKEEYTEWRNTTFDYKK